MKNTLFIAVYFISFSCLAQNDSLVNQLDVVIIQADKKLDKHSAGYKVERLNDSVIEKNIESFSNLLRFNAPIYLREYGAGGTSSASFRGTSASNTAVIWNGININSINNGQTGFNSLTVSLFDAIDIRSGGGSLEYGSGAIGGTIHLNDNLEFSSKSQTKNQAIASIGSYETYRGIYKLKVSQNKLAINAGISYNQSENDYPWLGTAFKNTNGAYQNLGINISGAFLISQASKLKLYTANYWGERFFSGELPNPTSANDKYQDLSNRNLLIYTNNQQRFNHEVKLAYLTQEYRYFENKAIEAYNFGSSRQFLINYNVSYAIPHLNASISSYSEYESAFGKTDRIDERNRRQFSQSFIYDQNIKGAFFLDAKIRKDFNSDYEVPFTYALGIKAKATQQLFVRANGSKNFRVPTYNDLFWPGQGNLDLKPETASQVEFGVGFKNNQFSIDIGSFFIHAKDKIVWTPNGDPERPGIWVPINISEVKNKGVELVLHYKAIFNKHAVEIDLNYSYTEAIDSETNKQVIFVPKHLANLNMGYSYKRLSFFFQQLFNGEVYTTESNSNDFVVPHYFVSNTGLDYRLLNGAKQQLSLGVKVNNLFDTYYVIQPRRPMPNRNFNLNINYKF
ncbi:TonB-dependent receptor domain-containing protein [Algibacter mikhailovii]|uniref:TonB-dependent receptor domain-containing protein n=1 Tax=Algibacter mikhailovii TaxID=425498 RepID=UPI002495837C|nr:TonB-dependent receptor [Algibacter mikhailovii]